MIVVDDGDELAESLGAAPLETVVRRGRDLDVRVVAAVRAHGRAARVLGLAARAAQGGARPAARCPDPDVDGDLLGVRLPRRTNPVFPPGRGYLVERGAVELVQVAV